MRIIYCGPKWTFSSRSFSKFACLPAALAQAVWRLRQRIRYGTLSERPTAEVPLRGLGHPRPPAPNSQRRHIVPARVLLDRLFGREPESSQLIAVLHLVDGLTLEEVAAQVGLSVSGVRYRLRALRAQLHALEGLEGEA